MGASESRAREENGETRESSDTALANESSGTALIAGAIAGAAILAVGMGVVSLMGDSSKPSKEKTMIAPGRGTRILRRPFEEDPATYFRKLWSDSSKSGEEKTMKAPGRDMRITRCNFEDPAIYFRNLRSDSSESGEEKTMKAPGSYPGVPSRRAPPPTSTTSRTTSGRSSRQLELPSIRRNLRCRLSLFWLCMVSLGILNGVFGY